MGRLDTDGGRRGAPSRGHLNGVVSEGKNPVGPGAGDQANFQRPADKPEIKKSDPQTAGRDRKAIECEGWGCTVASRRWMKTWEDLTSACLLGLCVAAICGQVVWYAVQVWQGR